MTDVDYLKRADEAEHLARLARTQAERAHLMKIAELWRQLAHSGAGARKGGPATPDA